MVKWRRNFKIDANKNVSVLVDESNDVTIRSPMAFHISKAF